MPAELLNKAERAVAAAKAAGANEAAATVSQSRDVEFQYRDGALEKVKDTTSQSLSLRVYADGRYSSHSTTDLNLDRMQGFISEAVAITRALEPDEYRQITPEELFANQPTDDLDLVGQQRLHRNRVVGADIRHVQRRDRVTEHLHARTR